MSEEYHSSEEISKKIDETLALASGEKINICHVLLRLIDEAPEADRPSLFRHVADCFDEVDSSRDVTMDEFISKGEQEQLERRYGDVVDDMLNMLVGDNPEEGEFYSKLWNLINNPLFGDAKTRTFAFYYVMIDKKIPYFKLDPGLRMGNEEWRTTAKALRSRRAKIRFILNREFEQRSEEADLVLRELVAVEDNERVALMGYVIYELRDAAKSAVRRLEAKLS